MVVAVTWAVVAAWAVGVAVMWAALGAAVAVWRWPAAVSAAGTQPTGIALRSSVMDGSPIAITGSFSSEDRSSPRTDMATTAGAGYRRRGECAASGFVVTTTNLSYPKIPSGMDWHHKVESLHR